MSLPETSPVFCFYFFNLVLVAPSKMELPMSPAAKTPTQEQFILEESDVQFETEPENVVPSDIERVVKRLNS